MSAAPSGAALISYIIAFEPYHKKKTGNKTVASLLRYPKGVLKVYYLTKKG